MVITTNIDDFIHKMTINNIRILDNVQLWQFSISSGNKYNYNKEIDVMKQNKKGLWSKPNSYEKYKNKNNILLVTDNEYTDILVFEDSKLKCREWWDNNISLSLGTININIIGRLKYKKEIMAKLCEYKRFSIHNRFQPIKKITYNRFINNITSDQ